MINEKQFRELIIQAPLKAIGLYSEESEALLLSICAQESNGGYYLKQTTEGENAALGPYQMQEATYNDIWENTLSKPEHSDLKLRILTACRYPLIPRADVMVYNLWYATIMARVFWLHVKESMPPCPDSSGTGLDKLWLLYKKYWNTAAGKATKEEFVAHYNQFVNGDSHVH